MTRRDLIILPIFFLLPFFYLSGTLTSSWTFCMRDLTYLFHPWRSLAAQMIQSGRMPLWNAYEMGGMPFLANGQSSILYPWTLLFYSFDFVNALKIFHWLHYALAGMGFFMLGRKLGFSRCASLFSGILFAFNGYALARLEFPSILGTLIWLPWMILFLPDSGRHFRLSLSGFSLALAFAFFSGFPQVFILESLFVLAFAAILPDRKNALALCASAGLVFLAIGAVQWIPTFELWKNSIRSGSGIDFKEAAMYSFPKNALLGLIHPSWIPHDPDRFTGEKHFWIWSAWSGVTAAVLALFSASQFRKGIFRLSFLFAILGVLWGLGNQLPSFKTIHEHFFLLRLFRYPPAALFWTVSGLCFLVLLGFRFLETAVRPSRVRAGAAAVLVLLLAVELQFYSRRLLVVLPGEYFHHAFESIRTIQKDNPGTALLSPKVDSARKIPGITSYHAAVKFRAFLFDLTNLPYRIRTIIPSGEPLALKGFQEMRAKFFRQSFQDSRAVINAFNVTHFLTNDELDKTWRLLSEEDGLKVYRNPQAAGEIFSVSPTFKENFQINSIQRANDVRIENDKISAAVELKEEAALVTHVPYCPGWKIFCRDCGSHPAERLSAFKPLEMFLGSSLAPGRHRIFLRYLPFSWTFSLSMSLAAILGGAVFGFHRGKKILQSHAV